MRPYAVLAALLLVWGCGSQAAQEQPPYRDDAAKKSAPPKPISKDAEVKTGERAVDEKDKDKRGNTPPGMTRSGEAPAAGAIVDPAGVTTK